MKNIGRANGNTASGGFDGRKSGVIIHGIVGQKYFLATAPAHVQSGEIVQCTGSGNTSE
jgi:hypothetical protein